MEKLKPCPWRIRGKRTQSRTVKGEYFYKEEFMPCMGAKCPCFDADQILCRRDGANFDMFEVDDGRVYKA